MKNLIVYGTKHGTTEKCANLLAEKLKAETKVVSLKGKTNIDINDYDNILIGGSINAGSIQKSVKKFCNNNIDILKQKNIGLFVCCRSNPDEAIEYINNNFPEELVNKAFIKEYFGWGLYYEKMNFIERALLKKISGINETSEDIKEGNISKFADKVNNL